MFAIRIEIYFEIMKTSLNSHSICYEVAMKKSKRARKIRIIIGLMIYLMIYISVNTYLSEC